MSGALIGAGVCIGVIFLIVLINNAVLLGNADELLRVLRGTNCLITGDPTIEQFYCPEYDENCWVVSYPVRYSISNTSDAYMVTICDMGPYYSSTDALQEKQKQQTTYAVGQSVQCYFDSEVPYVCYWQWPGYLRVGPLTWVIVSAVIMVICCLVPLVVGLALFVV